MTKRGFERLYLQLEAQKHLAHHRISGQPKHDTNKSS